MNLLKSILKGVALVTGMMTLFVGVVFLFYLVSKAFGLAASLVAMILVGGIWLGVVIWSFDRIKE